MPTYLSADSRASTVNQDGLVIEMIPEMKWLDPDKFPLINILEQLKKSEPRKRMKHEWRERRPRPRVMTIVTADSAAANQIRVSAADGDLIEKMVDHYLYRPSTGEIMLYQSESSGTLTVLSKDGASAAPLTTTVVGEKIVILNNSHAEGEAPADAFSQQEDSYYNYMQEIVRTVESSNIQQLEEHYGEDQRTADQRAAMIETFRDYDLTSWVGKRTRETTSATGRRRHMIGGILERVASNVTDFTHVGAGFSYEALCEAMRPCTEHTNSSSNHMLFAGTNAFMGISSWAENKLFTDGKDNTYGVRIAMIRTPYGDLPLTREIQFSAANGIADLAVILDLDKVVRTFMPAKTVTGASTGGDLHMILNYNTTNPFVSKDLITGIVGMELYLEELHAKMVNIT